MNNLHATNLSTFNDLGKRENEKRDENKRYDNDK